MGGAAVLALVLALLCASVPLADLAARRIARTLDADWREMAIGWAEVQALPEPLCRTMREIDPVAVPEVSHSVLWGFGLTVAALSAASLWPGQAELIRIAATVALGFGLLVALLTDLRIQLLPDRVLWPLAVLGAGLSVAGAGVPPQTALAGALAGGGAFWLLAALYRVARGRTGLGLGDVKLMALAGLWLGWGPLPWMALAAATGGIVAHLARLRDPEGRMPFGPALILALLLVRVPMP